MERACKCVFLSLLMGTLAAPAFADVIAQHDSASWVNSNTFHIGQSFTTSSGTWTEIQFNFERRFTTDPAVMVPKAVGTLFLFSSQYSGTPDAMSTASPGFLSSSTGIVNNVYQFPSSLTLQGNTQYYVYTDEPFGAFSNTSSNQYSAGQFFNANNGSSNFSSSFPDFDALFLVSGTAVAVPEPSAFVLLSSGAMALVLRRRRLTKKLDVFTADDDCFLKATADKLAAN